MTQDEAKILWVIADMHGGEVTIARQSLARFEPAGTLEIFETAQGGITIRRARDHSHDANLPTIRYNWDQ